MGESAEELLERLYPWAFGELSSRRSTEVKYGYGAEFQRTEYWTTREGTRIRLEDMTPSHRGNTIRMLERQARLTNGLTVEKLHATPLIKKMKRLGIE